MDESKKKSFISYHFVTRWFDWCTWIFVLILLVAFPTSEISKFKFGLMFLAMFLPVRLVYLIIVDFNCHKVDGE